MPPILRRMRPARRWVVATCRRCRCPRCRDLRAPRQRFPMVAAQELPVAAAPRGRAAARVSWVAGTPWRTVFWQPLAALATGALERKRGRRPGSHRSATRRSNQPPEYSLGLRLHREAVACKGFYYRSCSAPRTCDACANCRILAESEAKQYSRRIVGHDSSQYGREVVRRDRPVSWR